MNHASGWDATPFGSVGRRFAMFQSTVSTQDATSDPGLSGSFRPISIHASTQDATLFRRSRRSWIDYFNPRIHTGCDQDPRTPSSSALHFNPRIHTGCDDKKYFHYDMYDLFQSTHPHGMRHVVPVSTLSAGTDFNPRIHTGCDECRNILPCSFDISIHASTRDATMTRP